MPHRHVSLSVAGLLCLLWLAGDASAQGVGAIDGPQLYRALRQRDPKGLIKTIGPEAEIVRYTIRQTVDGVSHRVLIFHWVKEGRMALIVPLSKSLPGEPLSARTQEEARARMAPTLFVRIRDIATPGHFTLAAYSLVDGPKSVAEFEERLDQVLRSVAGTRKIWEGLRS